MIDEIKTATAEATPAEAAAETLPTDITIPSEAGADEAAADANKGVDADGQRVVRVLSVGQPVKGIVKRVSEFGAFIDIGVGRDGLVHISELSVRRVGKVTDVLQQGQEATFWIKKLDRERNRISLTMIEPGTKTIRDMEKGDVIQGTVTRIMPYGAFVDIGIGRDALLHVREMGERFVAKPEDVVQVGEQLDARIIDISRRRARVDLSIKGLRPEPEPVVPEQPETAAPATEPEVTESAPVDTFADVEVLNPFAAALRRAEQAGGVKLNLRKDDRRNRKGDGSHHRALQEEVLSRTLASSPKK